MSESVYLIREQGSGEPRCLTLSADRAAYAKKKQLEVVNE